MIWSTSRSLKRKEGNAKDTNMIYPRDSDFSCLKIKMIGLEQQEIAVSKKSMIHPETVLSI